MGAEGRVCRTAGGRASEAVSFSLDSGCYRERRVSVALEAPEGCTVAFTTDGRTPTPADDSGSRRVQVELEALGEDVRGYLVSHASLMLPPDDPNARLLDSPLLPSGRVLRACAVRPDGTLGAPEARTYLLGIDLAQRFPGCPVVSVVVDPSDLLDYERGILATGAAYDAWRQTAEAQGIIEREETWLFEGNFSQVGSAWERPCLVQLFDEEGACTEVPAGISVVGKAARRKNQRSFALWFRDEYGAPCLPGELIAGAPNPRVLKLDAGGNNNEWIKFKGSLLCDLVRDRRLDAARTRPAVLFLNGEYWGPYELSEWVSAKMLHDRHGVDEQQVVLIIDGKVSEGEPGDEALHRELMAFAERDLAEPAAWAEFSQVMDVQSFADYCAARIYLGDADWSARGNDALWRTRDASWNGGRWQYVLFDVDFSAGAYRHPLTDASYDHLGRALERYPLFAAAMHNQAFCALFLKALREIGETCFSPKRVSEELGRHLRAWRPLMQDFYLRYGDYRGQWNAGLQLTQEFFDRRYGEIVPIALAWWRNHLSR